MRINMQVTRPDLQADCDIASIVVSEVCDAFRLDQGLAKIKDQIFTFAERTYSNRFQGG